MPDMQSPEPTSAAGAPLAPALVLGIAEDPDYAFGCECADPSLQIAQWGQEDASEGA